MNIEDYEKKMRDYGVSEADIQFMLKIYKEHLNKDSAPENAYQQFCCEAIESNFHPDDIRTAVEAIETLKTRQRSTK